MFTQPLAPLTVTTVTVDPLGAVVMIAKDVSPPSRILRFAVVTSAVPTPKLPAGIALGSGPGPGSGGGAPASRRPLDGAAASSSVLPELPFGSPPALPESVFSLGVSGSPPISPLAAFAPGFFFFG